MSIYTAQGVEESDGEVNKLLPPGVYPAEIISCEWKEVEKEGSDYLGAMMLKVGLKVTDEASEVAVTCNEIIMMPFPEAMDADGIRKSLAKLKELQIATDTTDMGDEIDNDLFVHKECQVELYIQAAKGGYAERNGVRSYMPA